MKNFRALVLLVVFLVAMVCIVRDVYPQGKLNFVIHNNTENPIRVFLWSVDHDFKMHGRHYPAPVNIMGADIKAGETFKMQPRKHNKSPYRYIFQWDNVKNWDSVDSRIFKFTVEPECSNVFIDSNGVVKS